MINDERLNGNQDIPIDEPTEKENISAEEAADSADEMDKTSENELSFFSDEPDFPSLKNADEEELTDENEPEYAELESDKPEEAASTDDIEQQQFAESSTAPESAEEIIESEQQGTPEVSDVKQTRVSSLFDLIEMCVFTIAAVFILISFFFRYSVVDGGSMENTLHDDEMLLLCCFMYTPENGDIVVVQDKSADLDQPIVKRIIALGGQTVRVSVDGIYVDGEKLDEPYVYMTPGKEDFPITPCYEFISRGLVTSYVDGEYYEISVPDDEIFVLGDHRNVSKDSRLIGTLHEDAIIGKVVLRFYPFEKFGKIE